MSRDWKKYSLEWSVKRLQERFPAANIVAVKPARSEENCYSCYDNFLICDQYGAPTYHAEAWAQGWEHLLALLNDLSNHVAKVRRVFLFAITTCILYPVQATWKAQHMLCLLNWHEKNCPTIHTDTAETCVHW